MVPFLPRQLYPMVQNQGPSNLVILVFPIILYLTVTYGFPLAITSSMPCGPTTVLSVNRIPLFPPWSLSQSFLLDHLYLSLPLTDLHTPYHGTHGYHIFLRSRENNINQGTEHPPNKDKATYQHLQSPQSPQPQIPRHKDTNTQSLGSTQENGSCTSPRQHSRADPTGGGAGELVLKAWEQESWPPPRSAMW